MNIQEFINGISNGAFDVQFRQLYGNSDIKLLKQKARYISAVEHFSMLFPTKSEIRIFSAPGRAEICGNHTDHQNGCVIASAVDLDTIAVVSPDDSDIIKIVSEGYGEIKVKAGAWNLKDGERGTSSALVKCICEELEKTGIKVSGLNAYITSDVPEGSGLSSSASFEVLISQVIIGLFYEGKTDTGKTAEICRKAENIGLGKSSGLMDQLSCACGGFVFIDFSDTNCPSVKNIDFDFSKAGYSLCITNTKDSHQNLSNEYSAVVSEMKHVAKAMGKSVLGEASEEDFFRILPELRKKCSDREILRAVHFFDENKRSQNVLSVLENGDMSEFLSIIEESGNSSAFLLQNLFSLSNPQSQEIPLALMMSKKILSGDGASRVHGGGFGGTIIAFVPNYRTDEYMTEMERIFGEKSCKVLSSRNIGGCEIVL